MTESATGIILRTRPLTETSLIVNWLTPTLGRISTVAKGARRPKSPFAGKLDLFYEADFNFARSRRSELHTLREVRLHHPHPALRVELGYLQQASYCAALIEQTTESETPLPEIHELFAGLLHHLPAQPPQPRSVYAFELKLLTALGLFPDLDQTKLTPATQTLLESLRAGSWSKLNQLAPTANQVKELRQFLHGYLIFHLGRIPKSRPT